MKVYIDLIILLNFYLDFLLLITTSIILKRHASLKRVLLGSLVGGLSMLLLIIPLNNLIVNILKLLIAVGMMLATFNFKNTKYTFTNLAYFYMLGIILGGFLYYLNIEFSYTNIGLVFINKGLNINAIFLIIISPIILYVYFKQNRSLKTNYSLYYPVKITIANKDYNFNGYLDTGNKLKDPITNKSIILIAKDSVNLSNLKFYYIPFNSLNNHNLLKCFKPDTLFINNKEYKNYLIGISDKNFKIDGIECILNNKLMEEL